MTCNVIMFPIVKEVWLCHLFHRKESLWFWVNVCLWNTTLWGRALIPAYLWLEANFSFFCPKRRPRKSIQSVFWTDSQCTKALRCPAWLFKQSQLYCSGCSQSRLCAGATWHGLYNKKQNTNVLLEARSRCQKSVCTQLLALEHQ